MRRVRLDCQTRAVPRAVEHLLAAQGRDAARILRSIVDGGNGASREAVRQELLGVDDFVGVSGVTSFDEAGGSRKALHILTVRKGSIEEVEDRR